MTPTDPTQPTQPADSAEPELPTREETERLVRERYDKAARLAAGGRALYVNRFRTEDHTAAAKREFEVEEAAALDAGHTGEFIGTRDCTLMGRVMIVRNFGKAGFFVLADGAGALQVYVKLGVADEAGYELFKHGLDAGDIVGVTGPLFRTKHGEVTLRARTLALLTKSVRPLPEKWHGLKDVELRYRQRYVDLITNPEVKQVFAARSRAIAFIRRFLDERGYIEVETPMMQPIYGGAAAKPFVTKHNALDMKLFLRIAPELYLKRLIVGGFERVYEINRNFRNEGLSTRHNPEFTMLELYTAGWDYMDTMALTEELLRAAAAAAGGAADHVSFNGDSISFSDFHRISLIEAAEKSLGLNDSTLKWDMNLTTLQHALGSSFDNACTHLLYGQEYLEQQDSLDVKCEKLKQMWADTMSDKVVNALGESGLAEQKNIINRALIIYGFFDQTRRPMEFTSDQVIVNIFERLVEPTLIQPTFVYDYPKSLCPLTKSKAEDPATAERFELFIGGMECANAYSELNDPAEQLRRFEEQVARRAAGDEEAMSDIDRDYVRALEYGMPPCSGLGIGIDRLVMLLTGQASIRDVILFPQMRPEK